jgi:two-component system CheB/CheR fusion protein
MDDKIEGVVVTFVDVTDRREAEERWGQSQRRLLSELSHRVRSILALTQSIVAQTLRDNGANEAAQMALAARLKSVAITQDLLARNEWNAVDLGAVANAQLGKKSPRMVVEGPVINLPSEVATALGVMLCELAANASSSGALSVPGGRVRLSWEVIEADRGRRLRLVWKEDGAPRGSQPHEASYSHYLIEHDLPAAQVQRELGPSGFVCTIELPITNAIERGQ